MVCTFEVGKSCKFSLEKNTLFLKESEKKIGFGAMPKKTKCFPINNKIN
jgi:hypothetical protein